MPINNSGLHIRRFEFKYVLPERRIDQVRRSIRNFVEFDSFTDSKKGYYPVTSLYFDNLSLKSYYEKLAGLKFRKKFRVRHYDNKASDNTRAYFEVKKRDEVIIFKDRFPSNIKTVRDVLEKGQYEKLKGNDNYGEFMSPFLSGRLRPTVLVTYKREAYMDVKNSNFRLTFDYDICAKRVWGLDFEVESYSEPLSKGFVVLEAKFNRIMPAWFGMIIKSNNLRSEAFSKYCFSVESCGIVTRIDLPEYLQWI